MNRTVTVLWLVLGVIMFSVHAFGAEVIWDTSVAADATITDGAGGWSTNSGNFNSGSASIVWSNSVNSGDTVKFGGGSSGAAGTVTITGTVTPAGLSFVPPSSGTYTLTGGTIALQGAGPTITFTKPVNIRSVLTSEAGSILTFSGANAGVTTFDINTVGSIGGTVNLNGTYLFLNFSSGNNSLAGASTITVGSGNTIRYASAISVSSATSYILDGAGAGSNRGALSFYSTAGTFTISGNITLAGNTIIATRSSGLTFAGNIGESGGSRALTIMGDSYSSTTTLSGNNTFSGGLWIVNPSTVDGVATKIIAGRDTAFGTGPLTVGTTAFGTSTVTVDLNGKSVAIGGLSGGASKYFIQSDNGEATLTITNTAAYTFSGIVRDGAGSVALIKGNSGTLTLSGINTYSGATTISNGVLKLGIDMALPNTAAINVAGGTYDLGGFTVTNGVVSLSAGTITNGTLWSSSLLISGTPTLPSATLAATTRMVLASDSVLNLNGASTSVAELSGSGSVSNGTMTVTGFLMPGGSNVVGTLTLTNLVMGAGSAFLGEYNASTSDVVSVSRQLTAGANCTVTLNPLGGVTPPPTRVTLFTYGTLADAANLATWTVTGSDVSKYRCSVSYDATSVYVAIARRGTTITLY